MEPLLSTIQIRVSDHLFLKDPSTSELGQKILSGGINLMDRVGFEDFSFRRLGMDIGSPEASMYRYFENKQKFLLYLTSWYWGWMEYKLVFSISNVKSPKEKMERVLDLLTEAPVGDRGHEHINLGALRRIVMTESSKSYLIKDVDEENKLGAYAAYKRFVGRVSMVVLEMNPRYRYPHMLVSTIIEGIHHQRFFADHLPSLTDLKQGEDMVKKCYSEILWRTLTPKK